MMGVTVVTVTMMGLLHLLSVVMASSSSSLDALLQDYAYRAFNGARTRTGVVYNGFAPLNMTGVRVSAMRLRSGSLRSRGVSRFGEFEIPKGVIFRRPYVERLVLVYHNLGNWSVVYYPPPPGYSYAAPLIGLVAYDASNLTAKNLPHLYIQAPETRPISIHFSTYGIQKAKCVVFDLNGSFRLTDVLSGGICTTLHQGHFSIVVESPGTAGKKRESWKRKEWIAIVLTVATVGAVVGCFAVVGIWARRYRRRKRMHRMERAAEVGEGLRVSAVGSTKAPSATGTRTQPTLETDEYVT